MTFYEAVHDFILNSHLLPISSNHKSQPKMTQCCSITVLAYQSENMTF